MAIFSRIRQYNPAVRERESDKSIGEVQSVGGAPENEEDGKRTPRRKPSKVRACGPRPSTARIAEALGRENQSWPASHVGLQDADRAADAEGEEELQSLVPALLSTIHHFFGSFFPLFRKVTDPREPCKIRYPMEMLAYAGILMFLCGLGARRQIGLLLRNRTSIGNGLALFGVEGFPHGDTLDDAFSRVKPEEFQEIVCTMTEILIRKKVLYPWRLLDKYYVVAVDGTGMITFKSRHCPHCLTRTQNGVTQYYHNVLEAKIVTANGFVFSLMTEFIENAGEQMSKQDCEVRAFYRLADRLNKRFPRLPICLSMDGLYAGGPTFETCDRYGWQFVIVLKDDGLPYVNQEFRSLSRMQPENRLIWHTGKRNEVRQDLWWINDVHYVDTNKTAHTLSVLECMETKPWKGERRTTKFKWVMSHKVTSNNAVAFANSGGRIRWKVENEGFNVQKNGGYGLEHAYSQNTSSCKVFYFLLQIAHMLSQLLQKGSLLRNIFPRGCGSAKNLARLLLEAWRTIRLTSERIRDICTSRFQIRFDSS